MAYDLNTRWYVNSGAVGASDNNGGGFVPGSSGTDYSQQGAPQFALTGVTSSGAGNTVLTASAATTMVGNFINVVSGTNFHTGPFQIASVVAGVSITCDTNTAGQSISSGVGASGVMNVGGAFLTLTQAVSVAIQNNTINCAGSETRTTTLTLSLAYSGSAAHFTPYTISGFTTTPGDGGQFTLQTATNSVNVLTIATAAGQIKLQNLLIKSTAGTPGDGIEAGTSGASYDIFLDNCRITGCHQGIRSPFSTQYFLVPLTLHNCEIDNCTSDGIITISQLQMFFCDIRANGGHGVNLQTAAGQAAAGFTAVGCIFEGNTSDGVNHNTTASSVESSCGAWILNCVFYNNTGYGYFLATNGPVSFLFENNILSTNGTGAGSTGNNVIYVGLIDRNFYWNNTTARNNFITGPNDVTGSGDPFNGASSGDFSLNNTAGAGAACRNAGFPGVLQRGGTGYADIGALRHQDAGGGSTVVVNVNRTTFVTRRK